MKSSFKQLIEWSEGEFSILPWRQNRTLYTTLVSEMMLQQTTVGTVLNHYSDFIHQFPDLDSLAALEEDELRLAWKGLGYYRRAANLLKAAQALKQKELFPDSEQELQEIPGIGPYTAGAIRAIGHDLPALAVDGNLKRVLSRYFKIDTPYEKGLDDAIRSLTNNNAFRQVLDECGPRKLNEALMDLGRSICRSKNPLCLTCPLNNSCEAFKAGRAEQFPIRVKKDKVKMSELHLIRYIVQQENSILLYQKEKGEWLEGQWELPTTCIKTEDKDFKQYPLEIREIPGEKALKTGITRYKIHNYAFCSCKNEILENIPEYKKRTWRFFELNNLPHTSTASLKILKKIKLL